MVIVDSSVWIDFQREPTSVAGRELDSLLAARDVVMVGPVLAEILQGSRSEREFGFFASRLTALDYLEADQQTWVEVGRVGAHLKRQGVTLGFADLIISSLAIQHGLSVYTLDGDFNRVPGLSLHTPGGQ
jgi:predicted nucleic acid-binding protein